MKEKTGFKALDYLPEKYQRMIDSISDERGNDDVPYLTKATPGPWTIERVEGGGIVTKGGLIYCRIKSKQRTFAYSGVYGPPNEPHISEEEAEANARIMANSRELFEACEKLIEYKDKGFELYGEAVLNGGMIEALVHIQDILIKTK